MPICECFDGFAGADCGLIANSLAPGAEVKVMLHKGTSKLYSTKVSSANLELQASKTVGSLHVYTKIVNEKVSLRDRGQELMGVNGSWFGHAKIPSPVNFDSAFLLEGDEESKTETITSQDIATYETDMGDYTLYVLVVNKASYSGIEEGDRIPAESTLLVNYGSKAADEGATGWWYLMALLPVLLALAVGIPVALGVTRHRQEV